MDNRQFIGCLLRFSCVLLVIVLKMNNLFFFKNLV
jgi:hypothetical protein